MYIGIEMFVSQTTERDFWKYSNIKMECASCENIKNGKVERNSVTFKHFGATFDHKSLYICQLEQQAKQCF